MAEIIDLTARRDAANQPDADCVRHDDDGQPLYRFALQYEMAGKSWVGPEIWAYSFEDAEARVAAMLESLVLVGQIKGAGLL